MKALKIRAWDNILCEMIYSKVEQFDDSLLFRFDKHFETEKPIYMEYTGLLDKKGKEGFESDIVGLEDMLGEQFYGVIKWIGDKKAMYVIEMSGSHYPMSLLSDCEIVGNIYSNPELLEVTP